MGRLLSFIALAAIITLPGCNARLMPIDGAGRSPNPTRFVGQETLDMIKPDTTTSEWVLSMMGRPSTVESIYGSPSKVWRYEYELVKQDDGVTYRMLPERPQGRIARAIHMEISAGYVKRMWIE